MSTIANTQKDTPKNTLYRIKSIQIKIALWTGLSLLLLATIIIGIAAISLRNTAIETAEQQAVVVAESEAARVEAELETALDTVRTLAQAWSMIKDKENPTSLSREQVNEMLRHVLEENPQFLGTYTLWEPNTFDGLDSNYVNADKAHDETGRLIPYWTRDLQNNIYVEALIEYETPGIGDWYLLPKQTKEEQVLSPFFYPVQGVDVLLSSLVAPIVVDEHFYGIVGIDLRVDFLQQLADQIDLQMGTGTMALLSSAGTLAGVTGRPDLINQPGAALFSNFDEIQPLLEAGKRFVLTHPEENELLVFAPINLGQTKMPWWVGLIVPLDTVTAEPTAIMGRLIGVGVVLTVVGLALLWVVAGQIAQPIKAITQIAQAVAAGDLDTRTHIDHSRFKSGDEIGVLATAFNNMTGQLQDLVGSLEQRVVARTQRLETVAVLGEQLSAILNFEQLLIELVNQVKDRFNYYHAHIYILDADRQNLMMMAGVGQAGVEMKTGDHHIPLNAPTSLVARAARTEQIVAVDNVRETPDWTPNPLLPDTYAEMAVPIIVDNQVVGVLDVQEDEIAGLDEGDAGLLRSLANHVAVAIRNIRLFEEVETALAEAQSAQAKYVEQAWEQARSGSQRSKYCYNRSDAPPLAVETRAEAKKQAFHQNRPAIVALDSAATSGDEPNPKSKIQNPKSIVAPVSVAGQIIGALQLHNVKDDDESQSWTQEDLALVEAIVDQVAQSAENLRLFDETQQRAGREQTIRKITEDMQSAADMESLVKMTTEALGAYFSVDYATVELGFEKDEG